ncbi:hypothetical protein D3C87_2088910 [compost metagenome]
MLCEKVGYVIVEFPDLNPCAAVFRLRYKEVFRINAKFELRISQQVQGIEFLPDFCKALKVTLLIVLVFFGLEQRSQHA